MNKDTETNNGLRLTPFDNGFQPLLEYQRCYVGFSGGLDSTVLLHAFVRFVRQQSLANPPAIIAIHVNHQLHNNSAVWQQHCRQICGVLDVTFVSEQVTVQSDGKGFESAARTQRYAAFKRQLQGGTAEGKIALLLAHHANDQAETLLMRLFRGAGTAGAASIPTQRKLGNTDLVRPLLDFTREQLFAYAQHHQLQFIDDPSNRDDRFDRNFIRNQVLPLVEQRWSGAVNALNRYVGIAAGDAALLDELAGIDIQSVEQHASPYGASLAITDLLRLSPQRRINLVRYWLSVHQLLRPTQMRISEIEQLLHCQAAQSNTNPTVTLGDYQLSIYRDSLYLFNAAYLARVTQVMQFGVTCNGIDKIEVADFGRLSAQGTVLMPEGLAPGQYRLASRRDGVQYRYRGMTRSLKKWFNEQCIPPWFRDCYPIIYSGDQLAAIPGHIVCDDFRSVEGWQPVWEWLTPDKV